MAYIGLPGVRNFFDASFETVGWTMTGAELADDLRGSAYHDVIRGFAGNDLIYGGPTSINVQLGDMLDGGAGNDTIYGRTGNDTVLGGTGNDTLNGDMGNDVFRAGDGDDKIYDVSPTLNSVLVNGGNDIIWCGNGTDTVVAGSGNDKVYGEAGNDRLTGMENDDLLDGGLGNDKLYGGLGKDTLIGGDGLDSLSGDGGNDILRGGKGVDRLYGDGVPFGPPGTGRDTFDFNSALEAASDNIIDFRRGFDKIDLLDIDAKAGTPLNDRFIFIGAAAFHHIKGELHYQKLDRPGTSSDQTILSADVNGDAVADFKIFVTGLHTLGATDFVL
ncbi:MAG: M10 family metallopeptidase C-terminal domain-containing protein [Hyphomicrobium sp.]